MCVSAVTLRGDVFHIRAITVVELAFKKLHVSATKEGKTKRSSFETSVL